MNDITVKCYTCDRNEPGLYTLCATCDDPVCTKEPCSYWTVIPNNPVTDKLCVCAKCKDDIDAYWETLDVKIEEEIDQGQ